MAKLLFNVYQINLAERRRLSCLFAKNVLIIVIQQPFPYDKNVIENPHFSDVAKMSIDMDGKMVGTGMGKNNLNAKLENDGKMVGTGCGHEPRRMGT